jgi:hypothetical protein
MPDVVIEMNGGTTDSPKKNNHPNVINSICTWIIECLTTSSKKRKRHAGIRRKN